MTEAGKPQGSGVPHKNPNMARPLSRVHTQYKGPRINPKTGKEIATNPKDLTPEKRAIFMASLRKGLTASDAARNAHLNYNSMSRWRYWVKGLAEEWDEAIEEGTDRLEDVMFGRAVEGIDEPIYQQGQLVGHRKVYSDSIAITLLKGRRPEKYKDRSSTEISGPGGSPVQLVNMTAEEFQQLAMKVIENI